MSLFDVSNNEDIIDSRDIIARHEELEERREFWALPESEREAQDDTVVYDEGPLDEAEAEELAELTRLIEQGELIADWLHGVTLIRDSYFTQYAKDLGEELNGSTSSHSWPHNHIDWDAAAADLQTDYTDVEYNGVTYWAQ